MCVCFFFCFAWAVLWQGLCSFGNFYKKLNVIIGGAPLASGLSFGLSCKTYKAVFFLTDGICFPCRRMPRNPLIHKTYFLVRLCFSCSSPSRPAVPPAPRSQAPRDSDSNKNTIFGNICNSFSEIRRDLCSSYFYCKSISLEKKMSFVNKKALFFISAPRKHAVGSGRWGRGPFREPWT